MRSSRRRLVLAVMAAAIAATCATNPATGKRELNLVSTKDEVAMGKQGAQEVEQTIGLYDAPALQAYVSELGKRLAAQSERPELPWSFAVVDDPAVNAFSLPGGPIYVTRGLLPYLDNEAQLIGVLGHEIGHVTARHAANQMSKAELAQLGLGIGAVVSEEVRRWAPVGAAGLGLLFLKFSRDDESEADRLSVRYALRAGYDVRQIPEVFAMFTRVSQLKGGGRLPQWLATHPNPEHREQALKSQIASLDLTGAKKTLDRAQYLNIINGIVYGDNPRHGITRGQRFYHPALKYSVELPQGWNKIEMNQAVAATSPQKDAEFDLTTTKAPSPQAALQSFSAQNGVQMSPVSVPTSGLSSSSAWFTAATDSGPVAGLVTFAQVDGRTLQLLSLAPAPRASDYRGVFERTHASLQQITDAATLGVQPARLHLQRVESATTLAALYQQAPAAVPLQEIAVLNATTPDAPLQPGQVYKWVSK